MATKPAGNFFRIRHYLHWLLAEKKRIEEGGMWEPWLSKEESLTRFTNEIAYCNKYLMSPYASYKGKGLVATIPKQYRRNRKGYEQGTR